MSSILVVESEGLITQLIQKHIAAEEYRVVMMLDGNDAVHFVLREMPVLVVLECMHPFLECYSLIQQLRNHPKCMHIPIIVVSSSPSPIDKVRAYEAGADSYLTKPFLPDELLAHIRRHLSRIQQSMLSPLTRLPGGLQVERAVDQKIRSVEPWSVLYLDLDNFKAFNDVYGFLAGNNMILLVGHICQRVVYEYGNADDFVGHIGGDDFVIVTNPDREKTLCWHILERYREESVVLYRPEDVERGTICGIDRKGRPYQFPLVSLSIGIVSDRFHCFRTAQEIGSLTAEAKRRAKQSSSNVSHLSLEWRNPRQEYGLPSAVSPSFDLITQLSRGLFHFAEEDVLAEYKS